MRRFADTCLGLFEAIYMDFGRRVVGVGRRCKVVGTPSPSVAHLARVPPPPSCGGASRLGVPSALSSADAVRQAAKRHVDGGLCPEIKQYAMTGGKGRRLGRQQ